MSTKRKTLRAMRLWSPTTTAMNSSVFYATKVTSHIKFHCWARHGSPKYKRKSTSQINNNNNSQKKCLHLPESRFWANLSTTMRTKRISDFRGTTKHLKMSIRLGISTWIEPIIQISLTTSSTRSTLTWIRVGNLSVWILISKAVKNKIILKELLKNKLTIRLSF